MKLADEVLGLLGDDGALSRRLSGYELRPQQLELAAAIAESVEQRGTLVAEAGTGVGKSFAYLLPAILWADREGKQILISTRTKALQEEEEMAAASGKQPPRLAMRKTHGDAAGSGDSDAHHVRSPHAPLLLLPASASIATRIDHCMLTVRAARSFSC